MASPWVIPGSITARGLVSYSLGLIHGLPGPAYHSPTTGEASACRPSETAYGPTMRSVVQFWIVL